jgi:IS1 family transposase
MNILPRELQSQIVAALCEGVSIRATERLTGVHRDTIMRLGVRVGQGCALVHDRLMRGLQVSRIEVDEVWSYVGKHQRFVKEDEGTDVGDQFIFLAIAGSAKAILSYCVGKRDMTNASIIMNDLRARVVGAPEISTDAFTAYRNAVEGAFGADCRFGQIDKKFAMDSARGDARRYSAGMVVKVSRKAVIGLPSDINTSYIERQNLTLRMQQRRFTRLTNAFSKKLENHRAAVSLYAAYYNLCRVHEALRVTPAMQLGVTDHVWTVSELVEAALSSAVPEPGGRQVGRFRVIDGNSKD